MPKFHYRITLADGTIAKRKTDRIYTHLIEISPPPIEEWVKDMNDNIARQEKYIKQYQKTDKSIAEIAQSMLSAKLAQATEAYGNDYARIKSSMEYFEEYVRTNVTAERYAKTREMYEKTRDEAVAKRDSVIASGVTHVGGYFASNWCGTRELAYKKLNSADVRYWTDRGRTARIVPTPHAV